MQIAVSRFEGKV